MRPGTLFRIYKIQLTPKVIGKVAWIGIEKGVKVAPGQVVVRLEDAEFQARFKQAEGNLASLRARLAELETKCQNYHREAANYREQAEQLKLVRFFTKQSQVQNSPCRTINTRRRSYANNRWHFKQSYTIATPL